MIAPPVQSPNSISVEWPGFEVQAFGAGAVDDVCLYCIPLNRSAAELESAAGTLSADELARAHRFHFKRDRRRYVVARAALRQILGMCLELPPCGIAFKYGPHGKPRLSGPAAGAGVEFNLAHAEDLALVAVSRHSAIGVDLERVRHLDDFDALVSRFFSQRESLVFRQLTAELKAPAFFNLWTRKEALLKATGDGIAQYLHQVEVSLLPGEPAVLLSVPEQFGAASDWRIEDVPIGQGYAGAVAWRRNPQ